MGVTKSIAVVAAAAAFALVSHAGSAATISVGVEEVSPFYTTANSPSSHIAAGGQFAGVADVILRRNDGTFRCTGALLSGGQHILTAAHCVAGSGSTNKVSSGTATFKLSSGNASVGLGSVYVNPGWNGSVLNGNDLAIIQLSGAAPTGAAQYDIYRGTDEVGKVATHVGFGRSGTGLTGSTLASGTERFGQNRYDTTGAPFGFIGNRNAQLMYDFDDGTAAHDAMGFYLGASMADLGLGNNEVMAASGDSGGPSFIDGLIAGVTSYGMRLSKYVAGSYKSSDIDKVVNSSFGEIAGDTRVSSFASWIDSIIGTAQNSSVITTSYVPTVDSFQVVQTPEPMLGTLFGLGALALVVARRRRHATA